MRADLVTHSELSVPEAAVRGLEAPRSRDDALRGDVPGERERSDVETSSDRYALRFRGEVGAAFLVRQQAGVLRLLADLPRGAHVLDVGGGHAQLVPGLLARGHRVTVLGSDESCAHRLGRWLESGAVEFRSGDLLSLPFPDRSVDAAVSIRLLGHVREWPRLLDELARVARTTVVVDFASTRSLNALASRLFRWKTAIEGDTRPFRVLDPAAVETRLAVRGFAELARDPQYLLPMALYRLCRSARLMAAIERAAAGAGATRVFGSPVLLRASRRLRERPVPTLTDRTADQDPVDVRSCSSSTAQAIVR